MKELIMYNYDGEIVKSFPSISDASIYTNISVSQLTKAAKGAYNHYCRQHFFQYKDDYDLYGRLSCIKEQRQHRRVAQLKHNKIVAIYNSCAEAARNLSVSRQIINVIANNRSSTRTANGYSFRYLDEMNTSSH